MRVYALRHTLVIAEGSGIQQKNVKEPTPKYESAIKDFVTFGILDAESTGTQAK